MLGLRQQIRSNDFCLCRIVGNDQHFRRPRRQIAGGAVRIARHGLFRRRDPDIPRTKDLVDLGHARGPVGKRGDCLCATDFEYLLHAAQLRRHENGRVCAPVTVRRRAQNPRRTAGKTRRHREHDDARGQRRRTCRCIQAHARRDAPAVRSARRARLQADSGADLRGVERVHIGDGALRRVRCCSPPEQWRRAGDLGSRAVSRELVELHADRSAASGACSAASPSARTAGDDLPAAAHRARLQPRCGPGRRGRRALHRACPSRGCACAVRRASSRPAAPAARSHRRCFRLSSVSQNTVSRHTACTATRSGEPSSFGMMVGDSLPGRSLRISASAERGACSMMYLLSRTCCIYRRCSVRVAAPSHASPAASASGVRINTA